MAQSNYNVPDEDGANHLATLNAITVAIATNNSGAGEPSPTYAHMWWPDTTSGWVKQRNAANSSWEKKFPIAKARVDVASAATLDLDANAVTSDYLRITGTTTVTAVTLAAGQRRIAVAGGAFQLTNSASLIVQGGANYTTTAGDLLLFFGESGAVVRAYVIPNQMALYVALTGDQTIAGIKTFSTFPRISDTIPTVELNTGNGYGAIATKIARFTNAVVNDGSLYADSANDGATFTAPVKGVYGISISASFSGSCTFGVTKNSSQLTTNFISTTESTRLITVQATAANTSFGNATTVRLEAGDIVRFHGDGTSFGTVPAKFTMTRVA